MTSNHNVNSVLGRQNRTTGLRTYNLTIMRPTNPGSFTNSYCNQVHLGGNMEYLQKGFWFSSHLARFSHHFSDQCNISQSQAGKSLGPQMWHLWGLVTPVQVLWLCLTLSAGISVSRPVQLLGQFSRFFFSLGFEGGIVLMACELRREVSGADPVSDQQTWILGEFSSIFFLPSSPFETKLAILSFWGSSVGKF